MNEWWRSLVLWLLPTHASPQLPIMATHHGLQFIMPDGSRLTNYLSSSARSEAGAERKRGKGTTRRGKDLQFAQITLAKQKLLEAGADASQLAELRSLEEVGARRRRRWLNEKTLRDMCGNLTADSMERLFLPVPFGWHQPSPFEQISSSQHASVWEGFRNIDPDKEARLLQRWEAYNREQAAASRPKSSAGAGEAGSQQGGAGPSSSQGSGVALASEALQRWAAVSRKSRAALRQANVSSVLGLESQVLELLEEALVSSSTSSGASQQQPQMVIENLDSWGRLLVHGLCEFWGLLSKTAHSKGSAGSAQEDADRAPVVVYFRPPSSQHPLKPPTSPAALEITCTDIVEALRSQQQGDGVAGNLGPRQLLAWMRTHVHGSPAHESHGLTTITEMAEWVMV